MAPERTFGEGPEQQLRRACDELGKRLRAGESCQAEDFFHSYPALSSSPDHACELIWTELAARRELGEALDPLSWYARFPRWREQLQGWFRDQGLLSDSLQADPATVEHTPLNGEGATTVARPPGRMFGRYRLLDELGRGGMGVVYQAKDTLLGRIVALKMIGSGQLMRKEGVERFYREARAVAHLNHPHIVPLYEIGEHEGQHYFTMAYAAGGSLAQHKQRVGADPRTTAAMIEQIARAVHFAHGKGILHRDLKPGNIMIGERGEPLVSDFGLAKFVDADAELTHEGILVGTPAYMAPELAEGKPSAASARSDVWSLGVMLYELATGKRPFAGTGAKEVAMNVMLTEPVRPRAVKPKLDRGLETIILKCLEREPGRRYTTAEELGEDLARWSRGEPIKARPEGLGRRAWRWLSYRPGIAVGTILLSVFALAAVVFLPGQKKPSQSASTQEEVQKKALESIERDLAAGKRCVVIPENGRPEYYRFRTERHRPPFFGTPGPGPFFLESFSLCLLELAPDPQRNAFRLTAQISFRSTNEGSAGLYLMGEERPTPDGPLHVFVALTFAEQGVQAGKVRLSTFFYREATPTKSLFRLNDPFVVKELSLKPKEWHDLSVEVGLESMIASCDGKAFPKLNVAVERNRIALLWSRLETTANLSPPPSLAVRSSLGLFVQRGSARIKNVIVTPLARAKSK